MERPRSSASPVGPERRGRFGWLDAFILVLIALAVAWLVWRVQVALRYRWNWSIIPNFLLRWDEERGQWIANLLLQGFFTTIRLAVYGMIAATILGVMVGLGRISRDPFFRIVARAYVELMRNTPPLVIVFVFYFFVSSQLMPLLRLEEGAAALGPTGQAWVAFLFGDLRLLNAFASGVMCLALFEAAYIAEIVRAGIQSIEKGQWEAAAAMGLTRWAAMRKVILPQAVARTWPPLANQFVSLVKDSSIVSLISIQDLTFMASDVAVSTRRIYETWITVAVIYFLVCFALSMLFSWLERRARAASR